MRSPSPPYCRVFFDVDSTLVTLEGIDWLANGNEEVCAMTRAAMEGTIPIDQVYGRRLSLLRPTAQRVEELAGVYCASIVDGTDALLRALRDRETDIHLVSAGIEQAILPLAAKLGLSRRSVHAVALEFDAGGGYVDYDRRSLLTRPGGKAAVVRDIRARAHGNAAFVGDGASDAEARDAVDLFIGFGGVVVRPAVRERSDLFIDGPRLDALIPYLAGADPARSQP